jgi:hypothetical protein
MTYTKEHYLKHKDSILKATKKYYQENKDEICEKKKEKFDCYCGGRYTKNGKSTHFKTRKHLNYTN